MKPIIFEIVQGEEDLASHSGLGLIGVLLGKTRLRERLNAVALPLHPQPEISNSDVVFSMIGLLCLGQPDFAAIESFREDNFFRMALGLDQVPSEATLRQRLDDVQGAFDAILKEESAAMIRRHAPKIGACHGTIVPLDMDVSPFDNSGTKKEGVSWTYKKGVEGYAPNFAYLGLEGYWVNVELWEGSHHCQKGTPENLREAIRRSKRITSAPLLVRMDSGNDSIDNIRVCREEGAGWLIKRNLRRESVEEWLETAQKYGSVERPRPGKVVYRGEIGVERAEIEAPLRQVFEVIVRSSDATGQALLLPEVEVATFETSLSLAPAEVIELYHAHGTSEPFHSEIKTDMDLERLPSGKFATNALVLLLGMVAYNCLRLCGQESLREEEHLPPPERAPMRKKVQRRRLRSVMQDLIYMAVRLVRHARRIRLSFGRRNPWYGVWRRIYIRFTQGGESRAGWNSA